MASGRRHSLGKSLVAVWEQHGDRLGIHSVQGGICQCSRKVKPSGTLSSHAAVAVPTAERQTSYWVKTGMAKGQLQASRPQEALWAMSSGGSNGDPFKGEQGNRRPLRLRRLRLKKQKEQSPEASSLFRLLRQAEAGRRAQEVPHCLQEGAVPWEDLIPIPSALGSN